MVKLKQSYRLKKTAKLAKRKPKSIKFAEVRRLRAENYEDIK